MATGQGGGVFWRLEAGITSFDRQDGTPTVGAVMATTTAADTGSRTVALSTSQRVNDDYVDLGGQGVVQFGTASADVTGIDIADPNGGTVPAALIRWPDQLASLPGSDTGPTGWLWFAEASKRGSLDVHAPTGSSAPSAPRVSEPGALRTTDATSSPSRVP
jgi:hypothetical protein